MYTLITSLYVINIPENAHKFILKQRRVSVYIYIYIFFFFYISPHFIDEEAVAQSI
jgi:hypothetical protein